MEELDLTQHKGPLPKKESEFSRMIGCLSSMLGYFVVNNGALRPFQYNGATFINEGNSLMLKHNSKGCGGTKLVTVKGKDPNMLDQFQGETCC